MTELTSKLRKPKVTLAVSSVVLLATLILTEPLKLPLILLFVPFLVFFVWARSLSLVTLGAVYQRASIRKRKVIASTSAVVLVLVIVLQSLGQLSWRDLVIVVSLIGILGFYFNKTDLF